MRLMGDASGCALEAARHRRASCRPTRASPSCSCAATACASTTTTAASTSTSSRASARSTSATPTPPSPRRSPSRHRKLVHVTNLFYVEHRAELAVRPRAAARRRHEGVLRNSGAEANEGAIKLARKWATRKQARARTGSSRAERSFHGRTLAALAATGQPGKQEAFAPSARGLRPRAAQRHRGAGERDRRHGRRGHARGRAGRGRRLARDRRVPRGGASACATSAASLLMLDEVQTGFFRTGPAFAHQAFGITPDVVTLAKAMANGLPIGAVVARERGRRRVRAG